MSKFTLGQRQFRTLGLRSQQPKNKVGPTLSCYLGRGCDLGKLVPSSHKRGELRYTITDSSEYADHVLHLNSF